MAEWLAQTLPLYVYFIVGAVFLIAYLAPLSLLRSLKVFMESDRVTRSFHTRISVLRYTSLIITIVCLALYHFDIHLKVWMLFPLLVIFLEVNDLLFKARRYLTAIT